MSFRLFQGMIGQIKDIVEYEFGVIDNSGVILASSDEKKEGKDAYDIYLSLIEQEGECLLERDGFLYEKVYIKNKFEFVTYIESGHEDSRKLLSLISMNIKNSKLYYDEKFNKLNFIRNIITDNILLGDITVRAKELHINTDVSRQVFLINVGKQKDTQVYDILCNIFPDRIKNFIITIDEENIVIVREVEKNASRNETNKMAEMVISVLETEALERARVGISTVVRNIRDINKAYKEAEMAVTIGKIFEREKRIINYNKLGIGRLIYQLPTTLCKLFLTEVFKNEMVEILDGETVFTIQKFFENNLNVSETARQLFIHRNTLVYRLDKIQKMTGLDLRMFDDAIIFKVAMLVKNYLDENGNLKYK